jgi:hypothetical protein
MLHGSATTVTLTTVRPIGDDHAFVDAEQAITGADEGVILAVQLAALLRREGDTWHIVDSRPAAVAPPP